MRKSSGNLGAGKRISGFTLVEILVVLAIVGILAGIVVVAINPAKQFRSANDAKRKTDLNKIANAVFQYAVDFKGQFPRDITNAFQEVCLSGNSSSTCGNALTSLDSVATLNGPYIKSLSEDPLPQASRNSAANNVIGTGYRIRLAGTPPDVNIELDAPSQEGGTPIIVP